MSLFLYFELGSLLKSEAKT